MAVHRHPVASETATPTPRNGGAKRERQSMSHHQIPARHFKAATLRNLSKKGLFIVGMTTIPGEDGSFATGSTGYQIWDGQTGRIITFLQVLEMAK